MKYLIALLFPLTLFAETTGNLLNQTYFNGSTPINGWSGTNDHSHGDSIIAGVHGEYLENTITLGDTLNQSQMNGGWTSTFGSDIWHWNNYQSTVKMTQTITGADGSVTTQVRDVVSSPCGGINCGDYVTYTDSYTQGINNQSNFSIKVRYDFSDTSQSSSHWSPDVKNPTLIVEHSLLNTDQVKELNTINSDFKDTVEKIEFMPIASIEEVKFEPIIQTEVYATEEISIMPVDTVEDINKGIIDVFQIEEVNYDNNTQEQTFSTDFQEQEIVFETREIEEITTTETNTEEISEDIYETNFETGTTEQPIRESDTVELRETEVQEEPRKEDEPRVETNNREEQSTSEPVEERVDDSESERRTEETDTVAESNAQEQNEDDTVVEETERPSNTDDERVADDRNTDQAENEELVSVEDMIKEVNATITRVDLRLVATQQILAKAMVGNLNIDSYYKSDNNIFNKRKFDGGEFYETRKYIDERNLVAKNEGVYFDPLNEYQKRLQQINDKIRILERN